MKKAEKKKSNTSEDYGYNFYEELTPITSYCFEDKEQMLLVSGL